MRNSFEKPAEEPQNNAENPEQTGESSRPRRRPHSGMRKRLIAAALLATGGLAAQEKPTEQLVILPPFTKGQQNKQKPAEKDSPAEKIVRDLELEKWGGMPVSIKDSTDSPAPSPESRTESPVSRTEERLTPPHKTPEAPRKDLTDHHDELTAHMKDEGYSGSSLVKEAEALTRMAEEIIMKAEKDKHDLKKNLDMALAIVKSTHTEKSAEGKTALEKDYKKAVVDLEVKIVKAKMAIVDAQVARGRGLARVAEGEVDRMVGGKKHGEIKSR
jgi:hypothetical protein